jgi:hypothetical protein
MPGPHWNIPRTPYFLKLQHLQESVLLANGNFGSCTPVRELQVALKIPYEYAYVTKCRIQAEVFLNHINSIVRGTGQGETTPKV